MSATFMVTRLFSKRFMESIWQLVRPHYFAVQKSKMLKFYSNLISPDDLVFDVGANEGYMAEIFLKLGARVVCIEPEPSCISILKKKFCSNKNVSIIEMGLGEKVGVLSMSVSEATPQFSTFSENWKKGRWSNVSWNKKAEVKMTTLDNLIKKFGVPKFCKIDVEGFEPKVITGLSKKIHFISFEFDRDFLEDAKLCIQKISSLGNAKFNFTPYVSYKFLFKEWQPPEKILEAISSSKDKNLFGEVYASFE